MNTEKSSINYPYTKTMDNISNSLENIYLKNGNKISQNRTHIKAISYLSD